MLYEDLLFLWLAFLIGEFSPTLSFFSSSSFLFLIFLLKEFLFFFSLFYFSKKLFRFSERFLTYSKIFFIFIIFFLFFLDLSFFQFNKVLHKIYYGSILNLLWFLHYFIPLKLLLFRISITYLRIILGLLSPFVFLIIIKDTLEFLNLKFEGDLVLGILFIFLIGPFLIIKLWPLTPLKNSYLKKLILEFLSWQNIKFREIFVILEREKKFYTAGIIGFLPPFRYLFFSKNLLEILNPEEIIGVLAHEIGHLKKKHFFWLFLVLFNFPLFLLTSLSLFLYFFSLFFNLYNFYILDIFIAFLLIILSYIYLRYIFAYFLREFEREADLYSLFLLKDEKPLINALLKIGEATKQLYKKSWHHYGILERIEFLQKAKTELLFLKNYTKNLKIFLFLWIFFNLSLIFWFKNWEKIISKFFETFFKF